MLHWQNVQGAKLRLCPFFFVFRSVMCCAAAFERSNALRPECPQFQQNCPDAAAAAILKKFTN
jgi:hypothetical protein